MCLLFKNKKSYFELILDWLKGRFVFLTPNEFLETSRPGVLLTFDDGLANNFYNALPILEEFNASAILFVSTQHVQNTKDWLPATLKMIAEVWPDKNQVPPRVAEDFYNGMSTEQVVKCATHSLITIGGHSVSHPFLTQCSNEKLDEKVNKIDNNITRLTVKQSMVSGIYGILGGAITALLFFLASWLR